MERIVMIADQLDESRRLIQLGEVSHLRMALLLLDNAAEILIYRTVQSILAWREWKERMVEQARQVMPRDEFDRWYAEFGYAALGKGERRAIDREFTAKADFLVTEGKLEPNVSRVLKALHRYRNEAYHRDKVRPETIRPAALLLLHMAADMLCDLKPVAIAWRIDGDFERFRERFGIVHDLHIYGAGLERIRDTIKADMALDIRLVAASLADHLLSRLADLEVDLAFIVANSVGGWSAEDSLKRAQQWKTDKYVATSVNDQRFTTYRPRWISNDLRLWAIRAESLRQETDVLAAFGGFADLEADIENLEEPVQEVASHLDAQIQLDIDIARGK